jgi:hypothetical protein
MKSGLLSVEDKEERKRLEEGLKSFVEGYRSIAGR